MSTLTKIFVSADISTAEGRRQAPPLLVTEVNKLIHIEEEYVKQNPNRGSAYGAARGTDATIVMWAAFYSK